jgi:hypothetical protein
MTPRRALAARLLLRDVYMLSRTRVDRVELRR